MLWFLLVFMGFMFQCRSEVAVWLRMVFPGVIVGGLGKAYECFTQCINNARISPGFSDALLASRL